MPRTLKISYVALVLGIAWGCGSLKDAGPSGAPPDAAADGVIDADGSSSDDASGGPVDSDGGSEAGVVTDAGADVDPATVGAGPLGALPTGYCCASDDDCRYRHCEVVNGTKMCLDFCLGDDACSGVTTGFHCAFTDAGYGFCQPSAPGPTTCALQATYRHGKKPLGSCCQPLSDGRQGSECLSGVCDQNGAQNPFLCTTDCGKTTCPPTFTCGHADDFGLRYECLPVAFNYGCTP